MAFSTSTSQKKKKKHVSFFCTHHSLGRARTLTKSQGSERMLADGTSVCFFLFPKFNNGNSTSTSLAEPSKNSLPPPSLRDPESEGLARQ